jgi:uncharacterized membrane protein
VDVKDGLVAVYFPMSYQIGGYTALLPRSRIERLDLPVEAAMRLVLTGGISGTKIRRRRRGACPRSRRARRGGCPPCGGRCA